MDIQQVFEIQKQHQLKVKLSSCKERKAKLKKLRKAIESNEQAIFYALQQDLRKNAFETAVFEVFFIYGEIDFALKHLDSWMRPQYMPSNLANITTSAEIQYEPKGVCLIIAPWNYPFQLLMSPLVSAIAAGNCCMLKPSELAPATSAVINKLIKSTFDENEIAVFEGDATISKELLKQPFNHIFFTGSTHIGKIVMEAASKHLASVTLELGGKSPAIIDTHVDIKSVATKIAWGKFANAGQTCIAPDYVFVHEDQRDAFIEHFNDAVKKEFFKSGKLNKDDYGKIISESHYKRLKGLLADALKRGALVKVGGESDDHDRTLYPTLITSVSGEMQIMKEEIFGPILPVMTYKNLDEVIAYINKNEKPLALYVFSTKKKNIKTVLQQTSSGGVCVNDVLIQISNPNLSFGGVNASGIGGSHGFHGFKVFSHERSVMYQSRFFNIGKMVYPPYNGKNLILKFLRKIM